MASKLITDRQKTAQSVAAIGSAQGKELANALHAAFERAAAPAAAIDTQTFVQGLTQVLQRACADMVAADEAHESEQGDDPAARATRDEAVTRLRDRLVELREILTGLYGQQVARSVMPSTTPADPVVLARFAGAVVNNLSSQPLGKSRIKGVHVDVGSMGTAIENDRLVLEDVLRKVVKEQRENEVTLVRKNAAIAEYDRIYQGVANVLTGLFLLAGHDELADRVRPPARSLTSRRNNQSLPPGEMPPNQPGE